MRWSILLLACSCVAAKQDLKAAEPALTNCVLSQVAPLVGQASQALDSADWQATLDGFVLNAGIDAGLCAIEAAVVAFEAESRAANASYQRLTPAYLGSAPPLPNAILVARGYAYLEARHFRYITSP